MLFFVAAIFIFLVSRGRENYGNPSSQNMHQVELISLMTPKVGIVSSAEVSFPRKGHREPNV